MRRCILLVSGLCAGFCALWILIGQLSADCYKDAPVLCVKPATQISTSKPMEFPFHIPGTTLVAEQIVSYEGVFCEGEAPYDVTDVAALLLHNYGQSGISAMEVVLEANQVRFVFAADTVPAGARILVPEQSASAFGPKEFTSCSGWQIVDISDWNKEESVFLEYPDMGTVTVTNLTDRTLHGVTLLYKNYLPESDFYVGGTTRSYYIEKIGPNEYIRIYPPVYAFEYSRFVNIKIGNE